MTNKAAPHTSPVKFMDIAEIKVDEGFRDQLPPLSPEECRALKDEIKKEKSVRDAIILWEGKGIIVDGHNRFRIAQELKFKQVPVREKLFQDKEEVRIWIAKNQAGRRNLTGFQRAEAVLRLKGVIAAQAKKNQQESGGAVSKKSDKPVHTDKILADMAGMSHATLRQVEYILDHASDERKDSLRQGKESINKVHNELKKNEQGSTGDAMLDRQGGKKKQAVAPATTQKKGQSLIPQVVACLKRLDDLEKEFPNRGTRARIIGQVNKWLEEKKADSSTGQK